MIFPGMFTLLAFAALWGLLRLADRSNVQDRTRKDSVDNEEAKTAILHARQDLKLIAFLLGAIFLMLGIIADRIH